MKRFFFFLLAAALAFSLAAPVVYAQDSGDPPGVDFTVELYDLLTAGANHLYACITPDVTGSVWLRAEVSCNGAPLEDAATAWTDWGTDTERFLLAPTEEPYAGYLADKTPFTLTFAIYYKLSAEGEEYGPVIKEATHRYPAEYSALDMDSHTVYGLFAGSVTERVGWQRNIKYSVTAVRGTAPQELPFPTAMPVELQVHENNNAAWVGSVFYSSDWQTEPSSDDGSTAVYPLETLTLPVSDTDFTIRNRLYRFSATGAADAVAYPSTAEITASGPNAALYVNFVEPGYVPTVALVWNNRALEAIFDYKPTGAQALEVYTSTDGENWSLSSRIACGDGLPGDIYKETGYTVPILSQQQEAELLAASHEDPAQQGFYVRLRIIGGALGNRETAADGSFTFTETAALPWPGTYAFEPGDPGPIEGSGGNPGNVGSGGGERPEAPDSTSSSGSAPSVHLHDWGQRQADAHSHFYRCGSCGALDEVTPHTQDGSGRCVVCGYTAAPDSRAESRTPPESTASSSAASADTQTPSAPESTAAPESASDTANVSVSTGVSASDLSASGSASAAPAANIRLLPMAAGISAAAAAALSAVLFTRRQRKNK